MLESKTEYISAICDACKSNLIYLASPSKHPNFGRLESNFQWGSPLDSGPQTSFEVCEKCWVKALLALGLNPDIDASLYPEKRLADMSDRQQKAALTKATAILGGRECKVCTVCNFECQYRLGDGFVRDCETCNNCGYQIQ